MRKIIVALFAIVSLVVVGCSHGGGGSSSSSAKCPQHKPGNFTYPAQTVQQMWAQSKTVFNKYPYGNYTTQGTRPFCEVIKRKNANCADTAIIQRGYGQWRISTNWAKMDRLKKDGVKVGHVIYTVYVKNPKNGKMEWWYMDRNYGKGYPKMPMSKAAYLKKFKGKVKVVGSYTTTQNIAPEKFAPFKLPK